MVIAPFTHDDPVKQGLQVEAPALEYDVPVHGLQVLESGPENVPAEHGVAIPFTQDDPAKQGLQLEAPALE